MSEWSNPEPEDEFEEYLHKSLTDPGFRAAYEDAEERKRVLACLVKLRKTFSLTQAEVAHRMHTTQSSISEFEGGTTDPYLSTLQRYARAVTARIWIRVEMPAEGPWMPANRDIYSPGVQITLAAQPLEPTGQREISWRNYATVANNNNAHQSVQVKS